MKQSRRGFVTAVVGAGLAVHPASSPAAAATGDGLLRAELVAGGRLADTVKRSALAVLPLGSIEYHGPSAALGTDYLLGAGLAERVCRRLSELRAEAVLFPAVVYTHAPAHTLAFAGTVSIRPETVTMYLEDLLRSMVGMGFQKVLVLNAHDGNIGPGRAAVSQVAHENPKVHFLFVNWWESVPGPLVDSLHLFTQGNGGHGHGGPLEISSVAAVNPNALIAERGPDLPAPPELSEGFPYYVAKSSARGWPGYSGKVSEASPEKGEKILALATNRITDLVKRWLADPEAPGAW